MVVWACPVCPPPLLPVVTGCRRAAWLQVLPHSPRQRDCRSVWRPDSVCVRLSVRRRTRVLTNERQGWRACHVTDAILPYVVDDLISPHTRESGAMNPDTTYSLLAFIVLVSQLVGVYPWAQCVKRYGKWKAYLWCVPCECVPAVLREVAQGVTSRHCSFGIRFNIVLCFGTALKVFVARHDVLGAAILAALWGLSLGE